MDINRQTMPTDPVAVMRMEPNNGYHLADLDFQILIFTDKSYGKTQTILKKDCQKESEDSYLYYPDTELVGRGKYFATLTVQIPDPASPKGYRNQSVTMEVKELIIQ